ncbi:hypothetical protein F5Y15DRAFT_421662 [Xylariaceae sp. FL0016]|nr:hypothetical protein F5Y15DRAFT_421662 [Xylariaceae sp. FL0016]
MDSSPDQFFQSWNRQFLLMVERHDEELASHRRVLDRKKAEASRLYQDELAGLRAFVPHDQFESKILSMARGDLQHKLHQLEQEHLECIQPLKDAHRKERTQYEADYHRALKDHRVDSATVQRINCHLPRSLSIHSSALPSLRPLTNVSPIESSSANEVSLSRQPTKTKGELNHPQPASRKIETSPYSTPLLNASPKAIKETALPVPRRKSSSVRREVVNGAERLLLTCRPEKRKLQDIATKDPKRLCLNHFANSLQAPAATRSVEENSLCQRTVAFDDVYQDGEAANKDFIVEWPPASKKWYILKCEEHGKRFATRQPLIGAAKHLSSKVHGLTRNHDVAVRTLGYLVEDCNAERMRLNNQAASKAYAESHNLTKAIGITEHETPSETYNPVGREKPNAKKSKPKTSATSGRLDRDLGNSPTNARRITRPKPFRIYHCVWKENQMVYPVLILGWDDQKKGGLEDTSLASTGLLKKENRPGCYKYHLEMIVAWQKGYEDGGKREKWRKFPVMFFDGSNATAWVSASSLSKFPLYHPNPPSSQTHPFHFARNFITRQKGFTSWEECEASSQDGGNGSASPSSPYYITDYDALSLDWNETSESESENSEQNSVVSNETAELLRPVLEKGCEIPGDGDYMGSEVDSSLDEEMADWEAVECSSQPWTSYQLRGNANTVNGVAQAVHPTKVPAGSEAVLQGMSSARKLALQAIDTDLHASTLAAKTKNVFSTKSPIREMTGNSRMPQHEANLADVRLSIPETSGSFEPEAIQAPREDQEPTMTLENQKPADASQYHDSSEANPDNSSLSNDKPPSAFGDSEVHTESGATLAAGDLELVEKDAIFELAYFSYGEAIFQRKSKDEFCAQLFYTGGEKKVGGRIPFKTGQVEMAVDLLQVIGYRRKKLAEANMLILVIRDTELKMELVFDRSVGSKLKPGNPQQNAFIKWLREQNPAVQFLGATT